MEYFGIFTLCWGGQVICLGIQVLFTCCVNFCGAWLFIYVHQEVHNQEPGWLIQFGVVATPQLVENNDVAFAEMKNHQKGIESSQICLEIARVVEACSVCSDIVSERTAEGADRRIAIESEKITATGGVRV